MSHIMDAPLTTLECESCGKSFSTTTKQTRCAKCVMDGDNFIQGAEAPEEDVEIFDNEALEYMKQKGYEIVRLHVKGGCGQIYLLQDTKLQRYIALKTISEKYPTEEVKTRFINEAKFTAQLTHPSIIPVYELHLSEECPFYIMKWVEGITLCTLLDSLKDGNVESHQRYNHKVLLYIFLKICDAVAYAHSKHIIHRDLKPSNVMVGEFGEVQVMDWGLAKDLGEDFEMVDGEIREGKALTAYGMILGSPGYLSPEQAAGKTDQVSKHSDIFGLGSILYHIMTLEVPVTGSDTQVELRKTIIGDIPIPSYHLGKTPVKTRLLNWFFPSKLTLAQKYRCHSINTELSSITMTCLENDIGRRYDSVEHLQEDVIRYLEDKPPLAARMNLWRSMYLGVKRRLRRVFS